MNINSVCTLQDFPHRDWTNWNWNGKVSAHAERAYARVCRAALSEKKLSGIVPDSFVLYPLDSKDIPPSGFQTSYGAFQHDVKPIPGGCILLLTKFQTLDTLSPSDNTTRVVAHHLHLSSLESLQRHAFQPSFSMDSLSLAWTQNAWQKVLTLYKRDSAKSPSFATQWCWDPEGNTTRIPNQDTSQKKEPWTKTKTHNHTNPCQGWNALKRKSGVEKKVPKTGKKKTPKKKPWEHHRS